MGEGQLQFLKSLHFDFFGPFWTLYGSLTSCMNNFLCNDYQIYPPSRGGKPFEQINNFANHSFKNRVFLEICLHKWKTFDCFHKII